MPRRNLHPGVVALRYFEEAPLDMARQTLEFAKETIRRRMAGETVLTAAGPRIDPPQPKRKATRAPKVKPVVESVVMP